MAIGPTGFNATNYTNSSSYTSRTLRRINEIASQPTTIEQSLDPTYSFRQQTNNQYNHFRGFAECVVGSTRPFVNMVQHPVQTGIGIGVVAAACAVIGAPVVLGGLAIVGGTMGAIGFVRSANRAHQARMAGDIEGAYKEIRNMGASATGFATSVFTAGQASGISTKWYNPVSWFNAFKGSGANVLNASSGAVNNAASTLGSLRSNVQNLQVPNGQQVQAFVNSATQKLQAPTPSPSPSPSPTATAPTTAAPQQINIGQQLIRAWDGTAKHIPYVAPFADGDHKGYNFQRTAGLPPQYYMM